MGTLGEEGRSGVEPSSVGSGGERVGPADQHGRGGRQLRRWLTTKGLTGAPPHWYFVIKAARYLGVPPWDLMGQPAAWVDMALEMESAELHAHNDRVRKQNEKKR